MPLRDGELRLTGEMADGLLGMVDAIREILSHIEADGVEGETDYEPLTTRLQALLKGEPVEVSKDATVPVPSVAEAAADEADGALSDEEVSDVVTELTPKKAAPPKRTTAAKKAPTRKKSQTPAEAAPEVSTSAVEVATTETTPATPVENPAVVPAPVAKAEPVSAPAGDSAAKSASVADSTVRIEVDVLDKLMNLVGELVLARNQILQYCDSTDDAGMIAAAQRLNLITTELQGGVMKTRMQPIRNAWSKLPRVVRDLASSCGKKVDVVMEGADTELDKTILEAIKDPLTHIVRNSVDHGIESPDVREANGKPAEGVLCLRAFHEGGQVNIEISDDGAGINAQRVRAKAVEKGMVTAEQAAAMNDRELTSLILLPGFSTAQAVTNVPGRGVGMDVVKTNIERIGGTLDIHSSPGEGTTLRIKIPLTLASVPALIIKTAGDQCAIPQVSLLELVRLDGDRARDDIEFIHDAPVYRLRGNPLPLVYLDEQLELRTRRERHDARESINIVVLQAEDRPFGLVVDAVTDTQEIVVKPLGKQLKSIAAYAGATIMGDGSVALILDVLGLAQKSSVLTEHRDRALREGSSSAQDRSDERQSFLIVEPGDRTRAAIQLSTVARLEEFDASKIERSGNSDVVQYRGDILPLTSLGGYGTTNDESGRLHTVVYSTGDRSVGVVVGKIIDIVHEDITDKDGRLPARCVIQGRVTELVDLPGIVRQSFPDVA